MIWALPQVWSMTDIADDIGRLDAAITVGRGDDRRLMVPLVSGQRRQTVWERRPLGHGGKTANVKNLR